MNGIIISVLLIVSVFAVQNRGKLFCFRRISDQSREAEFEYEREDGKIYRGKTVFIFNVYDGAYNLLLDEPGAINWVSLLDSELNSSLPFSKEIFPVNRTGDNIEFRDDFSSYSLSLVSGTLYLYPYATDWDFENICFSRTNSSEIIFQYEVKSLNNGRIFKGETYVEGDNVQIQRFHMEDSGRSNIIFQFEFTNEEFKSNQTFCRGITESILYEKVLGVSQSNEIDPQALKLLVG